eukprot:CAMPEP_0117651716 /NCGR_PEP_ID=MMETSP0804-20121206/2243_1 /TAXON_ID=1074897 /ORGANISM="Tetraselmis astigmatica, Strain CCMP880" /LENGTH=533 /DNA_ID=CAMNT_0005457717 /DNA_START=174 /DNA_END=1772 /DNA_ORIENTATION=+
MRSDVESPYLPNWQTAQEPCAAGEAALGARWLTPCAPSEVTAFLLAWLAGQPGTQPSLDIISTASTVLDNTRRCAWHSWIDPEAPPAVTSAIGNWLMGLSGGPRPPVPSVMALSGLGGSPTQSGSSGSLRDSWDSPVWLPSSPTLKFACDRPATAETPRLSPLMPMYMEPERTGNASLGERLGHGASPNETPLGKGYHNEAPPAAVAESAMRQWMADASRSSLAVKGSVLSWAEQCQAVEASTAGGDDSFSSSWYKHSGPESAGSGLGPLVDVPALTSATYVATAAEAGGAAAAAGGGLPEPIFVGVWGPGCSGKTLAAATVVRSPAVRRAFCGGLVWLDVEALSRIGPADDAALVCRMLAEKVGRLPGCSPPWPPLHIAGNPSAGAEELRAWVAVRIANLPGPVLLVLDSVSSSSQVAGLSALGGSLLIISASRAHLDNLRSPRPGPEFVRPRTAEPLVVSCRKIHMGPLSEQEATVVLIVGSGCKLEGRTRDAAARVVAASGRLPKELALLAAIARMRAASRGLPCRDSDL